MDEDCSCIKLDVRVDTVGSGAGIEGEGYAWDTMVSKSSVVRGVVDKDSIGAGIDEDRGNLCKDSIVSLELEEFLWKFPNNV